MMRKWPWSFVAIAGRKHFAVQSRARLFTPKVLYVDSVREERNRESGIYR